MSRFLAARERFASALVGVFALVLAGCAAGWTPGTSAQLRFVTFTPLPTTAPTATPAAPVGWQVVTDPMYGFSLQLPTAFGQSDHESNVSGPGDFTQWMCQCAPAQLPPLQASLAGLNEIDIEATTSVPTPGPGDPNLCTQGTPVPVGRGLTGYEIDTLAPPPSNPTGAGLSGIPNAAVSVASGGVFITIRILGTPPGSTFLARYGPTWRHMLASFVPGPGLSNSHPCP